jgi:excisionase family DNA binding protein
MTSIKDKYLSMQTVSEILGCTERHVKDLIMESELEAIKIGGRAVRVSEQSLISFIDRKKVNPADLYDPDMENKQNESRQPAQHQQVARSKWIGR